MHSLKSPPSRTISYVIENDPQLFEPLIAKLQREMVAFGIGDKPARIRVGIALQESLTNALFHGNLECSSELRQEDERCFYRLADERRRLEPYQSRRIHVVACIDHERAEFSIIDEGPGFDVETFHHPLDPKALLRIGGRGLLLIRAFMDEVYLNETGNQITLVKRR